MGQQGSQGQAEEGSGQGEVGRTVQVERAPKAGSPAMVRRTEVTRLCRGEQNTTSVHIPTPVLDNLKS